MLADASGDDERDGGVEEDEEGDRGEADAEEVGADLDAGGREGGEVEERHFSARGSGVFVSRVFKAMTMRQPARGQTLRDEDGRDYSIASIRKEGKAFFAMREEETKGGKNWTFQTRRETQIVQFFEIAG